MQYEPLDCKRRARGRFFAPRTFPACTYILLLQSWTPFRCDKPCVHVSEMQVRAVESWNLDLSFIFYTKIFAVSSLSLWFLNFSFHFSASSFESVLLTLYHDGEQMDSSLIGNDVWLGATIQNRSTRKLMLLEGIWKAEAALLIRWVTLHVRWLYTVILEEA